MGSKYTKELALKQIRREHPCYGVQSMINVLPVEEKISYGKDTAYAVIMDC